MIRKVFEVFLMLAVVLVVTSRDATVVVMNWVWDCLNLYRRKGKIKEKSVNHTLGEVSL